MLKQSDVDKIAHLARLALTPDQKEAYRQQLSAILDHVEMLSELSMAEIEPMAPAVARENVMRDDVIEPCLALEDVLYNAANHTQNQFLIQSVLDHGDD